MADNPPPASPSGPLPPLPSSGTTGRPKSPTTQLPLKKGGVGKIVVMLSSVAKQPPAGTQSIPRVAPLADTPKIVRRPPPLPPNKVTPDIPPAPPRLSATTYVKLPPKTSEPRWSSLTGTPVAAPGEKEKESQAKKAGPPPLPAKRSQPIKGLSRKTGAQHIPPIRLNEPLPAADSSDESIFPSDRPAPAAKPEGWKNLEPGELNPPAGSLQTLEVFARSQRILDKPAPVTPVPEAQDKAAPLVAPPLRPPGRVETPATPELPPEKLPPPHLPAEARKGGTAPEPPELPAVQKVPAMIEPEAPAKPLFPPTSAVAKAIGSNWLKKKSTPIVVSSSSPKVAEAKPALKPAVLPKRLLASPGEPGGDASQPAPPAAEPMAAVEKTVAAASAVPSAEATLPAPPPPPSAKEKPQLTVLPAQPPPDAPVSLPAKAPLPLTRAARAKKRRFAETVIFWAVLVPLTVVALLIGSLFFGRETRVEGQVIPPAGMTLYNEVWIVSDFRELASGIAEDLAAERTPLMQEIQERRDHVQRTQADVAEREERIRLIQQEIQASKDEIASVVKQSRDATQQLWDGEGAQIDDEYEGHMAELKKAIADRAKSLNLKYEPDENFQSPEVWANAYRLALYEVPAGVDSVKEHQWIGEQMKQWRDFLKTLDDRKEQLREKAAQLKLEPAPKIADLNTKIEELQQRADGTAALYSLPVGSVTKHIPLAPNGRFSWVEDDPFVEGEKAHNYWIFARATRADGRQYWALHHFGISKNQTVELIIEPGGFISTKAILRPNLSPDEQEQ